MAIFSEGHIRLVLPSAKCKHQECGPQTDRIIDDQLGVLVVDRGIGVLPEDLGRVFDKFYRVADVGSSNGLGLGLAICKAFIEAHNGRITLENNPMGGTIVRFVVPFQEAATSWENLKL